MAYLNKEEALLKLSSFGVKSVSGVNRLIREQGLPARYISPRKVFFDENDIDLWLGRRHEVVARAYSTSAKILEYQRKKRRKDKDQNNEQGRETAGGETGAIPFSTKAKQAELKPVLAKEA